MAPVLLALTRPGAAPVAVFVDRALGLFWRLSGLCLVLVAALVFIWASGRALFDLGALPQWRLVGAARRAEPLGSLVA